MDIAIRPARTGLPRFLTALALCPAILAGAVAPASAGATAGSCSDASGQYTYSGDTLAQRDDPATPIPHEKLQEVTVAMREHVCVNKAGREFLSGSEHSVLRVRFRPPLWESDIDLTLLCEVVWDSYPNSADIDTACASERYRVNKQVSPELIDVE